MDWLKQIAPTIATALGGPLAGLAVDAVAKALNINADKVQETLDAGKLTSDQITQIKLAEIDLKGKAQDLGLNFEKLAVDDRKSARDMQSSVKSGLVPTLAIVIVGAFIAVVVGTLLGYSHLDTALAGTLVGYLSAKAEQVVAFYFGSSNGSQAKDQLLYNSAPVQQ